MSSTVLAVRAVSSEYAKQFLRPILFTGIGIYALVIAIVIWIAVEVSPWWLLLGVLPTLFFCIALTLWIIARIAVRRISPDMNKKQRQATKKIVGEVGTVAEQLGTPRFILIFRVIKDVMFPPKHSRTLISELTDIPGQLHRDFEDLRKLF